MSEGFEPPSQPVPAVPPTASPSAIPQPPPRFAPAPAGPPPSPEFAPAGPPPPPSGFGASHASASTSPEELQLLPQLAGAAIGFGALVVLWLILTSGGDSSILDTERTLPTVGATIDALGALLGGEGRFGERFWSDIGRTVGRFGAALFGGAMVGGAIGQAGRNPWTRGILEPVASFFAMVTPIPLALLAVLWWGITSSAVTWVGVVVTSGIVASRTVGFVGRLPAGDTRSNGIEAVHIMRLAVLAAWWSTLISEVLLGRQSGLGANLFNAMNFLRTDVLMAYMITIGIIGVVIDTAVRLIGHVIRQSTV